MIVAFSYFWERAVLASELMAALSVAAVDMAVETPTRFSVPMKKGMVLSSAVMSLTSKVAETKEAERATRAVAAKAKKKSCRGENEDDGDKRECRLVQSTKSSLSGSSYDFQLFYFFGASLEPAGLSTRVEGPPVWKASRRSRRGSRRETFFSPSVLSTIMMMEKATAKKLKKCCLRVAECVRSCVSRRATPVI